MAPGNQEKKNGRFSGNRFTRRTFLKRTGGATAATMLALHGMKVEVLAADDSDGTLTVTGAIISNGGSQQTPKPIEDGGSFSVLGEGFTESTKNKIHKVRLKLAINPPGLVVNGATKKINKNTPDQPLDISTGIIPIQVHFPPGENTTTVTVYLFKVIDGVETQIDKKTFYFTKTIQV